MWVYVLAMGAALLFAAGSVVQQRVAFEAPPEKTLSIAILLWLVRRRLWLAGVAASLVGNLLAAAALSQGGVTLVQPLITVRLPFALGVAALWSRVAVVRRDWAGAVAAAVGLGLFVAVGRPQMGQPLDVAPLDWLLALLGVAGVVSGLVLVATRLRPASKATLLATATGILFALQSSLTEVATRMFARHGAIALLLDWQPYVLAAAAITGAVLIQSAYEMAPLTASYPALATAEPLAGIAIGVAVVGGTLRTTPVAIAAEIVGLAVMTAGVYLLATSPLITGQLDALRRRRGEGMAFRTAAELERDLAALNRDLAAFDRNPYRQRERIVGHLRRAEKELARLGDLQHEMERYRAAEKEHVESLPSKEQMLLAPLEEELDRRAGEIDESAGRLERDLEALRERCRRLTNS